MYIYGKILLTSIYTCIFKLQFCKDVINYQLLTDNLVLCFFSIHMCYYIIKHITFNCNTAPNPCDFLTLSNHNRISSDHMKLCPRIACYLITITPHCIDHMPQDII